MKKTNKPLISAQHVSKHFGNFVALSDITFAIQRGEKVGLVGANGSGKTTLIQILLGIVEQDSGSIEKTKDISIAYVPQTFENISSMDVLEYLDGNKNESISALAEFGLSEGILNTQIGELSGGEKTKVALAKVMSHAYDLVILDEPTNNLDFEALSVLEKFVRESKSAFLIISHDRMFLDATVTRIIEIDEFTKKSALFEGNFSSYFESKRKMTEKAWSQYEDSIGTQKKFKASAVEKLDWMDRIKKERLSAKKLPRGEKEKPVAAYLRDQEGAMGRRARIIRERLEKFQETQSVEKPTTPLPLRIDFNSSDRSGTNVFSLHQVMKKKGVLEVGPLDLEVSYGQRILIAGKNGVGKTTLVRMLLGDEYPDRGDIVRGTNLRIGYLPQEGSLDSGKTVRDYISFSLPGAEEGDVRKVLNRFKIAASDIEKEMGQLSSGERSRVLLALMVSMKPNCIILDEPSNHLDFEALAELEEGLRNYEGTLIVVSHDRYFIEHVGFDRVLVLDAILRETSQYLDL